MELKRVTGMGSVMVLLCACGDAAPGEDTDETGTSWDGDETGTPPDANDSSGGDESRPPPPPCEPVVRGAWQDEAALPEAGDARHLLATREGASAFVYRDDTPEEVLVYTWAGTGSDWVAQDSVPASAAIDASIVLDDGRPLVITDEEPRSVFRLDESGWTPLGSLSFDAGPVVMTTTNSGILVALQSWTGQFAASQDDGETWSTLPDGPRSYWNADTVRLDENGGDVVLISGPDLLRRYDVVTGATIPSDFALTWPATASSPMPAGRWFGINLAYAADEDSGEIIPHRPVGVVFDDENRENVGFACSAPVVNESMDLDYKLLTLGDGIVLIVAGEMDDPDPALLVFDEQRGWARTPPPKSRLDAANVVLLADGSILSLPGFNPGQVERWAP
ncbi:MAG: hypothetical protein AAGA54_37315 [Myxococcota bacterium]